MQGCKKKKETEKMVS